MRRMVALALIVGTVSLGLTGCIASPVASTITKSENVRFEKACHDARGDYRVGTVWSVPSCIVTYDYPSYPGEQGSK